MFPLAIVTLTVTAVVNSNYYTFIDVYLKTGRGRGTGEDIKGSITLVIISDLILATVCLLFRARVLATFKTTIGSRAFTVSRRCFF